MNNGKGKVFVAMSGGVDSSVAAALLKQRGFNVIGAHMKCFNLDGCGERDAEDARRVAEQLGIPFYVFDLEKEYKKNVVEYMIDGYKNGITPNPDVMCNKEIKFGLFLKKALSLGADYVATGHYVRLVFSDRKIKSLNAKRYTLYAANDKNKDQSYFLWTLTQDQLRHCLFPVGDYAKPQIRKLAERFCLLTASKKDSQGICFLGQVSMADFLKRYIPEKPGDVLDVSGNIIGRHKGAYFYTIGQRHGFMANRLKVLDQKPQYVVAKDIKNNTLTVATGDISDSFLVKEIGLADVNLINPKLEIGNRKFRISILARVRYRQPLVRAFLIYHSSPPNFSLRFSQPQKYVASGQSAVFYLPKGEMLGGGVIV